MGLASFEILPAIPCPQCKKVNDRATNALSNHCPVPGAFAVCAYCGEVSVYERGVTGALTQRLATKKELHAAKEDDPGGYRILMKMVELAIRKLRYMAAD
jgi:hypothetical protein